MASAHLQITVESATNLYNADGFAAGKSDPYVIVEVPGQHDMKFQTKVLDDTLNPVWNHTGEIKGFMDGDLLQFAVWDSDTFPKPDQLLGKVSLQAQDFYPQGLDAELSLGDSKTQATLKVKIAVAGNLPVQQTLNVNVMKARNLYNADGILAGKSDPYCLCMVPGKPASKFKTNTVNNCLDPDWFFLGKIHDFVAGDSLELQVWDSDTFPKRDQLLGKVTLSPQDFLEHPTGLAGTFQLTGGVGGDQGILEVSIQVDGEGTYVDEGTNNLAGAKAGRVSTYGFAARANAAASAGSGRLKVTVQRAAGLYNADWGLAGKSDPYVVCGVQGKEDKKFQTPVINNNLDPVWNHVGMVKGFQEGDVLEFMVWDKDVFPKSDDFLGKLVLNSADFFPQGLQGEMLLTESKAQDATLSLVIEVLPEATTGTGGSMGQPGAPNQMTYGAPDAPGQMTYGGAPQPPEPQPVMTYGAGAPMPVTYSAPPGPPPAPTYGAPAYSTYIPYQAPTPSTAENIVSTTVGAGALYAVTKYLPVTVSPEEFAKGHGTLVHVSGPQGPQFGIGQASPLKITIVSARGLRDADWLPGAGKSDPYCVCEIAGKPKEAKIQTKVINNNLNPVWEHDAEVSGFEQGDTLVFKVYDKDVLRSDLLGELHLDSAQFCPQGFEGELPLANAGKGINAYLKLKIQVGQEEIKTQPGKEGKKKRRKLSVKRKCKNCC